MWLGPAAHRPYHPAYTHAVFRGWYDFGTGALGDMGHYSFYQIFTMLKLGSPRSVEAARSQYWKIENCGWQKQTNRLSYPQASLIRWEFPARGEMPPVSLHWYDGGLRPPLLTELEADGEGMPEEGLLLVGDGGKILGGFFGEEPAGASFDKAYPFAETILLGTIALRVNKKLRWDAAKIEFINSAEANQLRFRKNREGWEV